MLILSRKVGESFLIGDEVEIKVTEISGDRVKVGIEAPKDYKIIRKELQQTVESNREAATARSRETLGRLLQTIISNNEKGSDENEKPADSVGAVLVPQNMEAMLEKTTPTSPESK